MNKAELIKQLERISAIKYGDFTLKSGQQSKIYVDLRGVISYPRLLQSMADLMWQEVQTHSPDLLCGVPYTALPIATALSLKHQIPMVMRRKESKQYGTKKMLEGVFTAGQNCLIIEDVITTGSSIIETAELLKAAGLVVSDVVVFVDRQQGATENLQQHGYRVHRVMNLSELYNETAQ